MASSPVSARATATGYLKHPRTLNMDMEWQQDANNPAVFAGQLLAILNNAPALPTISIDTRPDIQFIPDLFDVVGCTVNRLGLSSFFRIGKIHHEWLAETGQAVRTTFRLEPNWDYNYWIFNSNSDLDGSQLGW